MQRRVSVGAEAGVGRCRGGCRYVQRWVSVGADAGVGRCRWWCR